MIRLVPRLTQEEPTPLLDAGLPSHLARVLWARGVHTAGEAEAFLSPSVEQLHDPLLLHDMGHAVRRIRQALADDARIVVYGDYDVDGVCATTILVEALRAHGGSVGWYIPSRHKEGYGLNMEAVAHLAQEAELLITVDCGITSVEEAALASSLGLDVIITDHHEPPATLPKAAAVVDPLLGDYPFRRLCGAGVALKLVWALFGRDALEHLWELAALATVADLVPLLGENRVIVSCGLARMQTTRRVGLKALFSVAGLEGKVISAGHLGFQIGPRINAGGRLHEASRNVDLLLTADEVLASGIARDLNEENAQRQRMEMDILVQAERWVRQHVDFLRDRVMLVVGEGWNTGVVGLAASRLVERFGWPAVVLSQGEDGMATGSARSIPGVNIHAALTRCADLFTRFGGHAQAAGMTLPVENIPQLRIRLNEAIEAVAEADAFIPSATYDLDINLAEVTIPLIEQLKRLSPTGFGNPSPVFRAGGAQVLEARAVGQSGKHLKLRLAQDGAAIDGIAFGKGEMQADLPSHVDVLFSPEINEYMGRVSPQCEVDRLLPHNPSAIFLHECKARADDFDLYLLSHAQARPTTTDADVLRALVADALTASCQGTLLTVRTVQGAMDWVAWLREAGLSSRVDYAFGATRDVRRFNALCALPDASAAEGYAQVIALDDALLPAAAAGWLPSDDTLRDLYRTIRAGQGRFRSERALAEAAGMQLAAVRLGLQAFEELALVSYQATPFSVALLPPRKCCLSESKTLHTIRATWMQEDRI